MACGLARGRERPGHSCSREAKLTLFGMLLASSRWINAGIEVYQALCDRGDDPLVYLACGDDHRSGASVLQHRDGSTAGLRSHHSSDPPRQRFSGARTAECRGEIVDTGIGWCGDTERDNDIYAKTVGPQRTNPLGRRRVDASREEYRGT